MLRPVSRPLRVLGLIATLAFGLRCGDDSTRSTPDIAPASTLDAGLSTLHEDPTATRLLSQLSASHERARAAGPHRLAYTATFELTPPPSDARPRVGPGRPVPQKITDALELRYAARPGEPPQFALHQENDADASRDIVVIDEQVYTKRKYGDWHVAPLESRHYERWLDEAEHCVFDVVELAAPRLRLVPSQAADRVRIELGTADTPDPSQQSSREHRRWHAQVDLEAITGHVTFEPSTGLWVEAELDVRYQLRRPDGIVLAGHTQLVASRGALDPAQPVVRPDDARPVPETPRYEAERERLLQGLGGR